MKYLGETFDIHCGGIDHVPVHHTNEIAQSECATHKTFVKYWMHSEFLLMGKEKVSKSKGGAINTLQSLIDSGYDPLAYRYFCLQAHYRSELNFSTEALDGVTAGLRKVYALRSENDPFRNAPAEYAKARDHVLQAINDDLALPTAVGLLNSYSSYRLWVEFDAILGLDIEKRANLVQETLPAEVLALMEARNEARQDKNWFESDATRNQLIEMGYVWETERLARQ